MATYALLMHLNIEQPIHIGSLGVFQYPSGYYVYVGSAARGMAARVARHMRPDKPLRWHVDYLTQHAPVVAALCDMGEGAQECEWVRLLGRMNSARVFPPGFGSSDCGCSGHLVYFPERPPPLAMLLGALYV